MDKFKKYLTKKIKICRKIMDEHEKYDYYLLEDAVVLERMNTYMDVLKEYSETIKRNRHG